LQSARKDRGDFHLNYNFQAPYYGVYSSNHPELAEPYYQTILDYMPKAREMARLFHCRGVHFPVAIGPEGLCIDDRDFGQRSNGLYSVLNFILHWEYTQDEQFLRRKAYPFMIELADFWEDYLQKDDRGRYVVYRSNMHEQPNRGLDMNPILDLALLRRLFEALLAASAELNTDQDRRAKWREILDHLSEYPTIMRHGRKIFADSESPLKVTLLSLRVMWPSGQLSLSSDPRLLEIGRNTLTELKPWRTGNLFPEAYPAAVRVGYPTVLEHVSQVIRKDMFPNLWVYQAGGGIETCGASLAINDMLVQGHEGFLRLFPVWPKHLPARFGNLRTPGAFLVSSELRKGQVQNILIESEKGKQCTILNPWSRSRPAVFELRRGSRKPVRIDWRGDQFSFSTRPGSRYVIEPQVQPLAVRQGRTPGLRKPHRGNVMEE